MARKKAEKLDVRMDTMKEKMESVREELGSLCEGISKIPTLEQGMTEMLTKLDAMSPNRGDGFDRRRGDGKIEVDCHRYLTSAIKLRRRRFE